MYIPLYRYGNYITSDLYIEGLSAHHGEWIQILKISIAYLIFSVEGNHKLRTMNKYSGANLD